MKKLHAAKIKSVHHTNAKLFLVLSIHSDIPLNMNVQSRKESRN